MFQRTVFILIAIVFTLSMIRMVSSIGANMKRKEELVERRNKLESVEKTNKELEKTLETVQTPAYIEKIAREKLGMAKSGEYVMLMPSPMITPTASTSAVVSSYWEEWMKRLL